MEVQINIFFKITIIQLLTERHAVPIL